MKRLALVVAVAFVAACSSGSKPAADTGAAQNAATTATPAVTDSGAKVDSTKKDSTAKPDSTKKDTTKKM